jgi:hypothetical protein
MHCRVITFALSVLAVLTPLHQVAAGGLLITPPQTGSIPTTPTNWDTGSRGFNHHLIFQQFDPSLGTLKGVEITLSSTIRNDYMLIFAMTPIPSTLYAATTATTDPSILSDPNKVQQLTDGPTVTLKAPDGIATIFGGPGATLPVDVVSLSEPSGTFSSMLPSTDPHFIAPSIATLSLSRTIDSSEPALFAQFIGKDTIDLRATAVAFSSFYSNSGNGGGLVRTTANAIVTIQYQYVPEPSGLILLGLGAGLLLLARQQCRRATCPAVGQFLYLLKHPTGPSQGPSR